jgi:hypothetical protein
MNKTLCTKVTTDTTATQPSLSPVGFEGTSFAMVKGGAL